MGCIDWKFGRYGPGQFDYMVYTTSVFWMRRSENSQVCPWESNYMVYSTRVFWHNQHSISIMKYIGWHHPER